MVLLNKQVTCLLTQVHLVTPAVFCLSWQWVVVDCRFVDTRMQLLAIPQSTLPRRALHNKVSCNRLIVPLLESIGNCLCTMKQCASFLHAQDTSPSRCRGRLPNHWDYESSGVWLATRNRRASFGNF